MENEKETNLAAVRCLNSGEIYDTLGAAAVLHRSPRWVAHACASGLIHGVKNGTWRIKGEAIEEYLRGGK